MLPQPLNSHSFAKRGGALPEPAYVGSSVSSAEREGDGSVECGAGG